MTQLIDVYNPPAINGLVEVVKDKLYFTISLDRNHPLLHERFNEIFSIDGIFKYEAFHEDFGPLNISHFVLFTELLDGKLKASNKRYLIYTFSSPQDRTNIVTLLGQYLIIRYNKTPDEAFLPFKELPLTKYRDASFGSCDYFITVLDCLRGFQKACFLRFFDIDAFDVNAYRYYERPEHGDLNWIIPKKFIAFSGPCNKTPGKSYMETTNPFSPDDYIPLLKGWKVGTIVRLNRATYEKQIFITNGFKHYDFIFADGSNPSEAMVYKFLEVAEAEPDVIAVHCMAGLGRTGTLIACYLMKHYAFTTLEAVAWIRLCRPGSIVGTQQYFLQEIQSKLWQIGQECRGINVLPIPMEVVTPTIESPIARAAVIRKNRRGLQKIRSRIDVASQYNLRSIKRTQTNADTSTTPQL